MPEVKRTERGWGGHFICSMQCAFRRNTLLEFGDIGIVVSTVGRMLRDRKEETIGYNRYYETMAFHINAGDKWKDANVSRQISFDSEWAISTPESEIEADAMHEAVVKELTEKLLSGTLFQETYNY